MVFVGQDRDRTTEAEKAEITNGLSVDFRHYLAALIIENMKVFPAMLQPPPKT